MIAFVQPFGLLSQGGGPRILRALLEDAPAPFISICTAPSPPPPQEIGPEVHLPLRRSFGFLEKTSVQKVLSYLDPLGARHFRRRLETLFVQKGVSAVHAIPHGLDFWYAYQVAERLGLPYFLNVHDDMTYNLQSRPYVDEAMKRLAYVWTRASDRIVISEMMGRTYCELYGEADYAIVTDGLTSVAEEPSVRAERNRIYLMGSIHMSYQQNFRSLIEALKSTREPEHDTAGLTLRGNVPFSLDIGDVEVDFLPWGTEADIERDLKSADFLYLPLPFEEKYRSFTAFSLSTKLITYLGSGIPILYQGPEYAAAAKLLQAHDAAIMVHSLDPPDLLEALQTPPNRLREVARNALELGKSQFMLADQRNRFWSMLNYDRNPVPVR